MKVKDLKAALERARDDDDVVFPVQAMFGSVGGTPCEHVTGVSFGFDWDHGKVFLKTEEVLHPAGETYKKEKAMAIAMAEKLASLRFTMSNTWLKPEAKLKLLKRSLEMDLRQK